MYLSHQLTAHDTILLVGGNFQEARNFESIAYRKDTKMYPFASICGLLSKKSIALSSSLDLNIPPLPKKSINASLLITEENNLLSIGGNLRTCYVLKNGKWSKHSRLNKNRFGGVFIDMPNGIYVFGGKTSPNTTEFLPKGSSIWQFGPELRLFEEKGRTKHEKSFRFGNGHKVSDTDIILIKRNHVINFNVKTNIFSYLSEIEHNDYYHCASVFYNGKIIISGGATMKTYLTNTTRIYDVKSKTCRKSGFLNDFRSRHKMAVISIDNKLKVVAFGGVGWIHKNLNSIEVFNEESESWTRLDTKMKIARGYLAHVEVSSTLFRNFM